MPEIPRNSKCPCNSGKKYKRCCGNENTISVKHHSSNQHFAIELLKVLALLQLYPENHGKNIRLEILISKTLTQLNEIIGEAIPKNIIAYIKTNCKPHHYEDPPEEFFTENIVFTNGNNIFFPGISMHGTQINQGLINAFTHGIATNIFTNKFVTKVQHGLLFILYIHNSIATELELIARIENDGLAEKLHIPSWNKIETQKDLFTFSTSRIASICNILGINPNIINEFVFTGNYNYIDAEDLEENPLLLKPFIKFNDEYLLVLPTAEAFCINEFIIESAKKEKCLETLVSLYNEHAFQELFPSFIKMKWKPLKFNFIQKAGTLTNFHLQETIFRFDTDKIGYVILLSENVSTMQEILEHINEHSAQLSQHINSASQIIKETYPNHKVFVVGITNHYRILNRFALGMDKVENVDEIFLSGKVPLESIIANWKFDNLSLWKYVKYLTIAEEKITFVPGNTHLSKFNWYKENEESFFKSNEEIVERTYFFGFEIEGEVFRNGQKKLDKISIPYFSESTFGYLQCIRKEKLFPVYISLEYQFGIVKSCLKKYKPAIWVQSKKQGDALADVYANAILYWLNEIYEDAKPFIDQLGELPIIFEIELDEKLYDLESMNVEDKELLFRYRLDFRNRTVFVSIPVEIVNHLSDSGNYGERIIIRFVLDSIGDFLEKLKKGNRLPYKDAIGIIDKHFNYPNKKMILHSDGGGDIKLAEVDLSSSRYIPNADVSFLLQSQISWLKESKQLPKTISTEEEKVTLLNDLVSIHLRKVQGLISNYPYLRLLENLVRRNEGLVRKRTFRKLSYPAKLSCYHKFYDVYEEFSKSESNLVETTLALRVLIEFVHCEKPDGIMIVSDDDIDLMLSHVLQIINYGFVSDSIKFGIENPSMKILKSGRLGIEKNTNTFHNKFKEDVHGEELFSYTERFKGFFSDPINRIQSEDEKAFFKRTETGFKADWGITLWTLNDIFHFLAIYCFNKRKSVLIIEASELHNELSKNLNLNEEQRNFFLEKFTLVERKSIMDIPDGYNLWDVFPWRYNRQLSYMTKPLIKLNIEEKTYFLLSPRQMLVSIENLISKFYDGTLKTGKGDKTIQSLLVQINIRKGKEFRNEIFKWLLENTDLDVIPHEVKISNRGFFRSEIDKGDIDILAIDRRNKILFSIECKNTAQAKVAYEFKQDIYNYLGIKEKEGLIQKHVKRDFWLKEHKDYVLTRLNLNLEYQIKSIVISNNILPLKYQEKAPLPIYSLYELKFGKFRFS